MFITSPMLETLSQIETKLNLLPMMPFLVYMHRRHLTFGKLFVRKQYNILIFLVLSAESVEVSIELSDDYYCNLSVPIPNEQTLNRLKLSQEYNQLKGKGTDILKKDALVLIELQQCSR